MFNISYSIFLGCLFVVFLLGCIAGGMFIMLRIEYLEKLEREQMKGGDNK